jgi:hypothetical protein
MNAAANADAVLNTDPAIVSAPDHLRTWYQVVLPFSQAFLAPFARGRIGVATVSEMAAVALGRAARCVACRGVRTALTILLAS